jgi:hypothetical protein
VNTVAPTFEDVPAVLTLSIWDGGLSLRIHPDVAESGEHSLLHHLVQGWQALRSPGPLVDARRYAVAYPEGIVNEHPAAYEVSRERAVGDMPRADWGRRGAQSKESPLDLMPLTVMEGPPGGS